MKQFWLSVRCLVGQPLLVLAVAYVHRACGYACWSCGRGWVRRVGPANWSRVPYRLYLFYFFVGSLSKNRFFLFLLLHLFTPRPFVAETLPLVAPFPWWPYTISVTSSLWTWAGTLTPVGVRLPLEGHARGMAAADVVGALRIHILKYAAKKNGAGVR